MSQRGVEYSGFVTRLVLGVCFCLHGWPKVWQVFQGESTEWVRYVYSQLGLKPALLYAALIAFGEALAGVAMLLGTFPRFAGLVIIVIMCGAIWTETLENGYFIDHKGFEYNLALIAMAASVMWTGPGIYAFKIQRQER